MKKYILALDEGTTSARAILFDRDARIVSMAQHEIMGHYPVPGWVEQDPMEIYASQYAALTECIAKSGISPDEIAAVGITNQRETVIAWDKRTGKPVAPAIVWQCRRTAEICKQLEAEGYAETVRAKTGLRLDPYFSGSKIKWILDHVEGAKSLADEGHLMVGTVDTWLIYKLTEGRVFVTDRTNASRTMLYNIHTDEWDEDMLRLFGVPRTSLPAVKSSSEVYATFECMGAELPISGIAGDQQAALFGQCCFEAGTAKNTYGTGCFLLAHTGERAVESRHGLLTTVAASEAGRPIEYVLEGSVFVGGAVVRWLRDEMRLIHDAADSEYFARKVEDTHGVYVVPAFSGLGAPYWDMRAQGSVLGLTAGTGKNHIIRAALASIAYQTEDVISAVNADMGEEAVTSLKVDGGASANTLLMQMQSDISHIDVLRFSGAEATATGVAFLAGLAVGFFSGREELLRKVRTDRVFHPETDAVERESGLRGWHRAVRACRAFTEGEEA